MGRLNLMLTPPPVVSGSYVIDGLLAGRLDVVRSAVAQMVLPVACVAILFAAPAFKHVRAVTIDVVRSDPLRFARVQGLAPRLIRHIVRRNTAATVVTFIGAELTGLLGVMSIVEYVFSWGGLGQWGINAIIQGDFNVVQGYVLALALFATAVLFIADALVFALDHRTRNSG